MILSVGRPGRCTKKAPKVLSHPGAAKSELTHSHAENFDGYFITKSKGHQGDLRLGRRVAGLDGRGRLRDDRPGRLGAVDRRDCLRTLSPGLVRPLRAVRPPHGRAPGRPGPARGGVAAVPGRLPPGRLVRA